MRRSRSARGTAGVAVTSIGTVIAGARRRDSWTREGREIALHAPVLQPFLAIFARKPAVYAVRANTLPEIDRFSALRGVAPGGDFGMVPPI